MAVIPYTLQLYRGLSSDEKPEGIPGDHFCETDTNKVFIREENGWSEEITGDNLKSGSLTAIEDGEDAVAFPTAFANVPNIIVSVEEEEPEHVISVTDITVNGFNIRLSDEGAGNRTVHWIACDAGNV